MSIIVRVSLVRPLTVDSLNGRFFTRVFLQSVGVEKEKEKMKLKNFDHFFFNRSFLECIGRFKESADNGLIEKVRSQNNIATIFRRLLNKFTIM